MSKKLPEVFANKVDKFAGNNEKVFDSSHSTSKISFEDTYKNTNFLSKNLNQKINDIFNSPNYIYKANVEIKMKDKNVIKKIVGRNSNYLITIENELIPISDIIDIKIKP